MSFSACTATGKPEPSRSLHALEERPIVGLLEVVDARVAHERLEADHAAVGELVEPVDVAGDEAAPEAEVDERRAASGLDLEVERRAVDRRRRRVQRHVEEARAATGGEGRGAGREPLPVGAPRIVEMHVRIDDAGEDVEAGGVDLRRGIARELRPDVGDQAVEDPDVGPCNTVGPTTRAPRTRTSKVPIAGGEVIVSPMSRLERRLAVARGDEPADTVVRGGRVLCVFTREWLDADVAIVDGVIAGIGEYDGAEVIDATGRYVVPGFIDAHMHLESVKLLVDEFARLVLPLGTTAVVADPHEIANVLGTDGVHWLLDASADLQLDVFFMAPSCVPASPFESPRRALAPGDLESLMRRNRVLGLAEMMNFPGVVAGAAVRAREARPRRRRARRRPCARARRQGLQAYAAAGIRSDHECLTADEGRERLRAGMWLLIREASMARNLKALLPLAVEYGPSGSRSAPTTATPRTSPRTATSTGWCARRSRSVSRRRTRS